jgi:hypothetical protein
MPQKVVKMSACDVVRAQILISFFLVPFPTT